MQKLKSKKERKALLGKSKSGFFEPKILHNKVAYGGGIKALDGDIEARNLDTFKLPVIFEIMERGIKIQCLKPFQGIDFTTGLTYNQINQIVLEDQEQIYEAKEKSVVGRALLGGVLLGPAGAIVGGMTGIGSKQKPAKMPDLVLSISYHDPKEGDKMLTFFVSQKEKKEVINYFQKYLGEYFDVKVNS